MSVGPVFRGRAGNMRSSQGAKEPAMKTLFKIIAAAAVILFVVLTIIKFIQHTTYKEAMGILEEGCKDLCSHCRCCGRETEEA
jgi:hypothetical protein